MIEPSTFIATRQGVGLGEAVDELVQSYISADK